MKTFINHIEQYLGRIEHGWSRTADGMSIPFQVVACRGGLIREVTSYLTLGLSEMELTSPVSRKMIRHELLMAVRTEDAAGSVPSLLQQLGSEALRQRTAYLRGDVVGPRGIIFKDTMFEAIYVTMPTYYPEPFSVFEESTGLMRVIAWLIPVTVSEAEFVRSHGWSRFESLIEKHDPDLLNLKRDSLV
jgi:hypothetical protein